MISVIQNSRGDFGEQQKGNSRSASSLLLANSAFKPLRRVNFRTPHRTDYPSLVGRKKHPSKILRFPTLLVRSSRHLSPRYDTIELYYCFVTLEMMG